MLNLTEEQIMSSWQGSYEKPLVTISTISFNHAKYIEQALDSFLSQETIFPFEILIHDDASTDGTSEIIKEYAEKYPRLIKPLIQTENQWSKGVNSITCTFNLPRAKGKYIALCETDDYWCDNKKLQNCCDFLEKHPDFSAVTHQTKMIDVDGNYLAYCSKLKEDTDIETLNSYLDFPHTSSYFFRNPLITENKDVIEKFKLVSGWDKSFVLFFLGTGKVKYFAATMSCYRFVISGGSSWSASMGKVNRTEMIIEAELAQLRQIKEYRLKINMAPHYYRNVMFYALRWVLKYPSKDNWILYRKGYRNCPKKVFFFPWLLVRIAGEAKRKVKKMINTKHNISTGGYKLVYNLPLHSVLMAA